MNELAIIFDRLGIAAQKVLLAAATKWNFRPFTPGVVAGHCIGADSSNISPNSDPGERAP
jgi:UDP-N-acetyl-D-glucosamine/UDP-N-acetyl-D-galactosamine dehydrogenase